MPLSFLPLLHLSAGGDQPGGSLQVTLAQGPVRTYVRAHVRTYEPCYLCLWCRLRQIAHARITYVGRYVRAYVRTYVLTYVIRRLVKGGHSWFRGGL